MEQNKNTNWQSSLSLGIELGSTRIKAVLIDEDGTTVAVGIHEWENKLEDSIWTYSLADAWAGVADSYAKLTAQVQTEHGVTLTRVGAIGISAMMHGYLTFDKDGNQLAPFRTWRNTMTERAADELTALFSFNIPLRWSIAHLYHSILQDEAHVRDIAFMTTLAGYMHWQLTGEKVLGVGDASGMFPIDSNTGAADYHADMLTAFDAHIASKQLPWTLEDILPRVLSAGPAAGVLSAQGASLLDPTGNLCPGIPLCPPEGDAGTGMVATNSVAARTGNVSAGTSVFAMIVMEHALSRLHREVDMVTTPCGKPVAMVHANNCTSDINAWVSLFHDMTKTLGLDIDKSALFEAFFSQALSGTADGGGLLAYNYYAGEPVTNIDGGRPLFTRLPDAPLDFASFARTHLFSAVATLKVGFDILFVEEKVCLDKLLGHGGFFKTKDAGQRIMAAAAGVPVAVMETADEGGAWGMALLADFMRRTVSAPATNSAVAAEPETLADYLANHIFAKQTVHTIAPVPSDVDGFTAFMARYMAGLPIERAAIECLV